jgi:arylsulfatase A-like enzyme
MVDIHKFFWNLIKRHLFAISILNFLFFSIFASCNNKQAQVDSRPNILWIAIDDGRADGVGSYGKSWAKTPHIDRLAKEGVRFHHAIVQNPVCVPSRNSMKTGYYAYEVGPVGMGKPPAIEGDYIDLQRMKKINESPSLLDAWTAIGMKPVNVGKIHAKHDRFDSRGDAPMLLNVYGSPTDYFKSNLGEIDGYLYTEPVFTKTHQWQIGGILDVKPEDTETWRLGDMAIDALEDLVKKQEPFFFRVSFHAPHVACYVPKDYYIDPSTIDLPFPTDQELAGKPAFEQGPIKTYVGADLTSEQIDLARGTYYGMMALVDVQVGRIVKALEDAGQLDKTIIAFTSDQGFQLGEHGIWKKRVFYEGNVRVPFILRYPRELPKNKVIEEPVEMVDFLPTLMEISGLQIPEEIRGRSLIPLINGEVATWREACFSEIDHSQSMYKELRQGTGRRVMVRTKEWKLIYFMDNRVVDKDGALYNLVSDPDEKINLYNDLQSKEVISRLENLAEEWTKGDTKKNPL